MRLRQVSLRGQFCHKIGHGPVRESDSYADSARRALGRNASGGATG